MIPGSVWLAQLVKPLLLSLGYRTLKRCGKFRLSLRELVSAFKVCLFLVKAFSWGISLASSSSYLAMLVAGLCSVASLDHQYLYFDARPGKEQHNCPFILAHEDSLNASSSSDASSTKDSISK